MYTSTRSLPDEFLGRKALVTGGSRGIGAAVAQRLIDGGATVVTVEQARQVLGGLDILVNNAGAALVHLDGVISDEEWLDSLNINFLSAVRTTAAALPALRASEHASVINISSNATGMAAPPLLHYAAAKAALDVYGRGLAMGLAPKVRVNTITPANYKVDGGP